MPQNPHQRKATDAVAKWLSANEHNIAWLAEKAKMDPGTAGDFLAYRRWPKLTTQGRIEKALGWPAGSIRQMGNGDDVEVPMTPTVGGDTQDASQFVESDTGRRVESGVTNEDLLREIMRSRAESDQVRAEVRDLSERVARLEQPGA